MITDDKLIKLDFDFELLKPSKCFWWLLAATAGGTLSDHIILQFFDSDCDSLSLESESQLEF